ncbi:sulfurtransferase [Orrella marina]|uniref:Rhodanese domain-containing protein n=1 Tax=Orrella marina TaxID=2163011 RepID=A0A2R4XG02_9BURK|nr:sulfurtransferase [Orrella marina]AWB32740.1 hypothetical protein DBV39_02315 [Orrella marina]
MTAEFLIEADELLANYDPRGALVIDARTPQAYQAGHIPGAVFLSTYGCFIPDSSQAGLHAFAMDVSSRYAAIGVTHDTPVVVYEDATGMRAAREMWILEWLGHRNVRMLHGGLDAWRAMGGDVEHREVKAVPSKFEPTINPELVITANEISQSLDKGSRKLIDVRDSDEYRGLDNTVCCDRRGHVPGAVWLEWTSFLQNGRYKSAESIRQLLASKGITDQNELVPYCHRGARSANAYFAFRYAGYARVRNFIGSMHEWSAHHDLPIEVELPTD